MSSSSPGTDVNLPNQRGSWLRWFRQTSLSLLGIGVVVWGLSGSVVFVDETEYVIVQRLGQIVAVYDQLDPVRGDRGLHFKLPWPIETVWRFDRRLQLFDPPGREMFTSDKKNITVDSYICWKIAELPADSKTPMLERPVVRFYRRLGTIARSESGLDSRLRSVLSSEMGKVDLSELLQITASEQGPSGESPFAKLAERVLEQVRQRSDESEDVSQQLGIEVVDVGLKRINLPEANLFAVYERMRKERAKIAQRYRSAGEAEKLVIESQARRQSAEILARANAEAEKIRGEGEAEALGILNQAHARDPEFYRLMRTLESYRKILNERTTLVLSASNGLMKLLTEGLPQLSPQTAGPATIPPELPARKDLAEPERINRAPATSVGGGP